MLDHARKAVNATRHRSRADLDGDDVLAAALERFVEIVGEAASKVTPQTRDRHSSIPWRQIVGMRHRLIHGYASVDHDVIWDVVTVDLPPLIDELERLTSS